MRTWLLVRMVLALAVVAVPMVLQAQEPAPVEGFTPVTPEQLAAGQEQIPAARLVFAAYSVVWLAFAFYLVTLWRRMVRVESELRSVTARLEEQRR